MGRRYFEKDLLPLIAMVTVECATVGTSILFKAATFKGMSYFVFIVYTYVIAAILLLPLLFIFPSSARLPSNRAPLFSRISLLVFVGLSSQIVGYKGLEYSSPTLASAISNLTPAFTFTLAVIFRMEKVMFRSSITQAKILGTLVSIGGALVVVLYKGPTVLSSASSTPGLSISHLSSSPSDWIVGGLLIAMQYLLYSTWFIIQTQVMAVYPAELTVVFFYNLCAAIISAPVCLLIAERDLSAWRLGSGMALIAVVYSGSIGANFSLVVHTWGVRLKGPVYTASFKPLSIALAAAMSVIFLGETLHLGSIVGSVILCAGFYAVLWGKAKEEAIDVDSRYGSSFGSSSDAKLPLLNDGKLYGT